MVKRTVLIVLSSLIGLKLGWPLQHQIIQVLLINSILRYVLYSIRGGKVNRNTIC